MDPPDHNRYRKRVTQAFTPRIVASLARMEARVLFEELLRQLPEFELAGPVKRLPSVLMNGLVRMPVLFKN